MASQFAESKRQKWQKQGGLGGGASRGRNILYVMDLSSFVESVI